MRASDDATSTPSYRPGPSDLLTLWELALDILVLVAPDGTFLHVNPAFSHVLGWAREDVVGRPAFEFVHPDDLAATEQGFRDIDGPGREVHEFENRYRTRDGAHRTLRWNARVSMDGRVIHAVARDVTDMQARVEALRLSEERFRLAMTSAAIGMAILDLDGRFVDVNDSLCRIVGRPRDVLTRLTFTDITHPDDIDTDVELARQLVTGAIDHYDLEKRYLHADGSVVWILLSGSVVRDRDGTPQHFIAQVQDISKRKRAEEELARTLTDLQQSNNTLAEFAAIAAHDLKTPLAIAGGMVDVVTLRYADNLPSEARELLSHGAAHLRRLANQVDGLLRIAAVAGRTLDLEPVPLDEAVATARAALGETLPGLVMVVDVPHVVMADRSAVTLLLQNLLTNAATHGATHVTVRSRLEDDQVRVDVDDDGPGIPPDQREVVFELFARGRTDGRSTGVGLALCRRIVDRHGGVIAIDDAPTGGARLWFRLPHVPPTVDRGRELTGRPA